MRSFNTLSLTIITLALMYPLHASDDTGERLFASICANCHGSRGEGNFELKAPSIASMPAWYVTRQLGKFRTDIRGNHTKDTSGQAMRAIAHSLKEEQVASLASYIAKLEAHPSKKTLDGDLRNGKYLFENICINCHRFNASGDLVFGSSPLTGLQDWYILAQLTKFRAGVRGAHKDDEKGAKMHQLTGYLKEKELIDVASYIPLLAEKFLTKNRP